MMKMKRRRRCFVHLARAAALAQTYPSRRIRTITPFAVGGWSNHSERMQPLRSTNRHRNVGRAGGGGRTLILDSFLLAGCRLGKPQTHVVAASGRIHPRSDETTQL
jgi:hypothetical protein